MAVSSLALRLRLPHSECVARQGMKVQHACTFCQDHGAVTTSPV
jgi:hypothetical protein